MIIRIGCKILCYWTWESQKNKKIILNKIGTVRKLINDGFEVIFEPETIQYFNYNNELNAGAKYRILRNDNLKYLLSIL